MRKVFWWGAAALVVGAGSAFMAAEYACCHPDSLLGRCMAPVSQRQTSPCAGSVVAGLEHALAASAVSASRCPHRSCKAAESLTAECPDAPSCPGAEEASEPIQIQMSECAPPCPVVPPPCPEGPGVCNGSGALLGKVCNVTPEGAGSEESEAAIPAMPQQPICEPSGLMPTCPEEEQEPMGELPYVQDDAEMKAESCCPFSAWLSWMKCPMVEDKEQKSKVADPDSGDTHEQSELAPDAEAMPTLPGSEPMSEEVPPMDLSTPPGAPVPEPGMMPSASGNPSAAPNCQEDPNHHYQYPGCPYMGGCPSGSGTCCPRMQEVAPASTGKDNKKKSESDSQESGGEAQEPGKEPSDQSKSKGCEHGRCGLDTMECRPTDATWATAGREKPF